MLNTLVSIVNEYMGSQWALFMPSEFNGTQYVSMKQEEMPVSQNISRGTQVPTLWLECTSYSLFV